MNYRAWLTALLVLLAPAVLRAQSTNNLSEDFTSGTTTNSWFYFNGACLTAADASSGSNPGQSVGTDSKGNPLYYLPGCVNIKSSYYNQDLVGGQKGYLGSTSAPATPDAAGNGALRFTNGKPGGYHQNGAIVSASPFSTGQGLQVTFKTVTYGGDKGGYAQDGADGISFYLVDGCMPITGGTPPSGCPSNPIYGSSTYPGIGAWGGSLAYTCSNTNPPYDGLVGAYLGLGIDEYGNFLNGTSLTNGETDYIKNSNGTPYNSGDNTASGGYYRPGRIGLRGAGSVAWQALTTAYGTNPGSGSSPYYPASLATTCSNGGTYSSSTNSCGPTCQTGYSYNAGNNTCVQCPAGTTFYPAGGSGGSGSCNSCPSGGTYNVSTNTCDGIGTCATGTYVPGTPGSCSPPGTCSAGSTYYISSTNMCGSCAAGTYLPGSIQCAVCTPGGTYNGSNGCTSTMTCSTGTLNTTTNECDSCSTGTLNITGGVGYCANICPSGYVFKTGTKIFFPTSCFTCSNGNSNLTVSSGGAAKCNNGGALSSTTIVTATTSAPTVTTNTLTYNAATQSASTPNNPQPITPTSVAPTVATPITGVPWSQVATQKTCSSGHLWNYSTAGSPTDAGTATLPNDPTTPNPKNTAGILDYGALPGAFSSLPSSPQLANETAGAKRTDAATVPIFYNLKITQNGLLSLAYSQGGGIYTNVINNLDITKSNGPIPSSFRFAFAGSTGGSTNIHEIMCFKAAPDVESASSVGINEQQASRIDTGTQAFFASFNPVDSTGRLAAYGISADSSGNVTIATQANWDAECNLTGVALSSKCPTTGVSGSISPESTSGSGGRQILTWNGSAGVAFTWSSISSAQQTALGSSDVLDYLRGVRTNEINSLGSGTLRTRDGVLGDIIDSSPTWVGPPGSGYVPNFQDRLNPADPLLENSATTSFLTFLQNHTSRENVVYVGANDGMLHAFRTEGSDGSGSNDGKEVLAYMPGAVVNTINNTTGALNYTSPLYSHNYFVDATPGFGDLFYSGTWHTWLAGGLASGGSAIYILDITDPGNFAESNADSLVVGEWIAGNDSTAGAVNCTTNNPSGLTNCGVNLGNVYDMPQMRRLHDGNWGVIFGNGLGSATGDAGIYILDINASTGAKTWYYLSTGSGSLASQGTDGIAGSTSVDFDGDRIIDYVYAGDINGKVWRFDLTSASPANWAAGSTPLFASPSGQPITTPPVVGGGVTSPDGLNRIMVSFGTGQKTPISSTSPATYLKTQQYIYGVWDWNLASFNSLAGTNFATLPSGTVAAPSGAITASSTTLQALPVTINSSGNHDINSSPQICFAGTSDCSSGNTQFGWSIALPEHNSQGYEQIIYNPVLNAGTVIVDSVLPADNQPTTCTENLDEGWTYAINILSGLPIANFFTNYHTTNTVGFRFDATGTPSELTTGTTDGFIFQTVGNTPIWQPKKPPAANSSHRLTWIQLR